MAAPCWLRAHATTKLTRHTQQHNKKTKVFTDALGDPAWGAPNFKPMLEATGFKEWHTNGELVCLRVLCCRAR